MRFIELFAGIGGFRLGLENIRPAKQSICKKSKDNDSIKNKLVEWKCIYSNEWNKYACQIYRKNFGKKELVEGDIRAISAESIPNHDLLTGGFPCPTYSIAGKRKGFEDPRGVVFFEICRIAKVKKPALLLLENVKGLLNHDNGNTFRIILDSLSELGYDCEWEVLNSKNFGVPQNRERVFIVGHLRGTGGQKIFPLGKTMREDNASGKRETSGCIKSGEGNIQNDNTYLIQLTEKQSQGYRVYDSKGISATLQGLAGGVGAKTGLYAVLTPDRFKKRQHGRRFKEDKEPSFTLTGQDVHGVSYGTSIRRLTPTECERLQGFPDGWTEGISDTQRYKCLGNAVTVNVVEEIGKKIAQI